VGHLFNKENKQSIVVNFYAYYKKDALEIAKEYATRFTSTQLVDLRLGEDN
jgi:outer membrane protein assembly factor BamD (BamD/ComL family)